VSLSMIGRKIGQYEIRSLVGSGGMATVYLGYQPNVDRLVAIKILPPHPALDPEFIQRFQLEARTIARLQHPHILQLFDYGSLDEILYFVTPYIEGGSLDRLLRKGPVLPERVETILKQVASALDYAHRQEIIHRDIKPGNILLDTEGNALLADFGIAKITSSTTNLTGTGVVGTPAYMSPEQTHGGSDHRADIYALGVVVFEMLTGKQPYRSESAVQLMLQHVQAPIPSILNEIPNLPSSLEPVMMRVLAKDPNDRYWSASEFADDFSRALHRGESLAAINPRTGDTTVEFHGSTPAPGFPGIPSANTDPSATLSVAPTPAYPQTPLSGTGVSPTGVSPTGTQPTIIVQNSSSNLVLLGGFALLAILILGGLFLLNNQNRPNSQTGDPTAQVIAANATNAAQAAQTSAAEPTQNNVPALPTFGALSFSTSREPGDTLSLRLQDIRPPSSDKVYVAWLVNTATNAQQQIGRVAVDALGSGALSFSAEDGTILPAQWNAILITEEDTGVADEAVPTGDVMYSGMFPEEIMTVFQQTFVSSEEGFQESGLLASALTEARFASQHAGLAAGASNIGGVHTHAEHTINIVDGTTTDYDGNGGGQNPGTGNGLYVYINALDDLLQTAVNMPQIDTTVQNNAENMRVCIANARIWADQLVAIEKEIIESDEFDAIQPKQEEATALAEQITSGVDQNGNGQVEPFEGECGLQDISRFGLLVGSLNLYEGPLGAAAETADAS
jgi:serine/threonine protein kinase